MTRDQLNAMTDCELYGHPNAAGSGCPCGASIVTPRTVELPAPVMFHLETSVWWAGVPSRQREAKVNVRLRHERRRIRSVYA